MGDYLQKLLSRILDVLFPKKQSEILIEELHKNNTLGNLSSTHHIQQKNCFALFSYKDPLVKEFIHQIKYQGNKKYIQSAGKLMYDHLLEEISERRLFQSALWIAPIPINKNHRNKRGYNPTEQLAQAILSHDPEKMMVYKPYLLQKTRETKSQTETHSREERLKNLNNSFEVKDEVLRDDILVIVIDDVTTTGATFVEAQRALSHAGFATVLCLALAH